MSPKSPRRMRRMEVPRAAGDAVALDILFAGLLVGFYWSSNVRGISVGEAVVFLQ